MVDEAYYARCTRVRDGGEEWFCYMEEPARDRLERDRIEAPPSIRLSAGSDLVGRRVMLLLTKSVGARGVLVGSAHRRAR